MRAGAVHIFAEATRAAAGAETHNGGHLIGMGLGARERAHPRDVVTLFRSLLGLGKSAARTAARGDGFTHLRPRRQNPRPHQHLARSLAY